MHAFREIFQQLNEPNRFRVLVYARMKYAMQLANVHQPVRARERRRTSRQHYPSAHWI